MANASLTPEQEVFLSLVGQDKNLAAQFYWTGGTVLASQYLHHRISDDIDLFTEAEEVPIEAITAWLGRHKSTLGYLDFDLNTSFHRHLIFLRYPGKRVLKTEFTSFPFPRVERGGQYAGVTLDSPRDIAVNKLFTINQKPRARDYVDLYFLMQEYGYTIEALRRLAKTKFDWHIDPIQLGSHFVNLDLTDWPGLLRPLTKAKLRRFFEDQVRYLGSEILKD